MKPKENQTQKPSRKIPRPGFFFGWVSGWSIASLKKRKKGAWEVFVKKHQSGLQRFLARLGADTSLAAEIAQEAFLSLYQKGIDTYDPDKGASLKTYLWRSALQKYKDSRNKEQNHQKSLQENQEKVLFFSPSTPASPLEVLEETHLLKRVQSAFSELSEIQKNAFVLVRLEGLSYKEAAQICDCKENTLSSHVRRATQTLKDQVFQKDLEAIAANPLQKLCAQEGR